jgi:hypothetical protein
MCSTDTELHDAASSRPSRLGKASVLLGLISPASMVVFGYVLPVALLLLAESADWEAAYEEVLFGLVKPLGFVVPAIASLTGIGLAVAGVFSKTCRRDAAVVGLMLNVIALSALVLLALWWMSALEDMMAC